MEYGIWNGNVEKYGSFTECNVLGSLQNDYLIMWRLKNFKIYVHVIVHWKAVDLEITDGEYRFYRTYAGKITPSHTLDPKHVEIIKVIVKPTFDTSFKSS